MIFRPRTLANTSKLPPPSSVSYPLTNRALTSTVSDQAIDTEKTAVLVHCAAGVRYVQSKIASMLISDHSRSATIVLAYLMKYHRKSLREAFLYTKKRRPAIGPNRYDEPHALLLCLFSFSLQRGFMEQLMTYERELFGGENSLTWQDYFELL